MAINKTLFRKIRNHILAEPRRYDQETYGAEVSSNVSPCGTVACLAGWAVFLGEGVNPASAVDDVPRKARKALGLTGSQSQIVFSPCPEYKWPKQFRARYEEAYDNSDKVTMARVAADYINYIIRTGKVS